MKHINGRFGDCREGCITHKDLVLLVEAKKTISDLYVQGVGGVGVVCEGGYFAMLLD